MWTCHFCAIFIFPSNVHKIAWSFCKDLDRINYKYLHKMIAEAINFNVSKKKFTSSRNVKCMYSSSSPKILVSGYKWNILFSNIGKLSIKCLDGDQFISAQLICIDPHIKIGNLHFGINTDTQIIFFSLSQVI